MLAAVLAGCGSGGGTTGEASARQPIVIGISLSLTGGFATDGQAFERGYRLWQSDVNSRGGILGRPVRLIILNDKSDQNKVVANYKALISVDHVDMTFGPFSSLLSAPASDAVAKYGYALICGACGAPSVFTTHAAVKDHSVFDPSLPVEFYMRPFVDWILSLPASQRPKTAAYPSAEDPFAQPAVLRAESILSKHGIRTVYNRSFPEKLSAYKTPAQDVASSGAQLVILGSTDVPTVASFMHTFEHANYNPKIFAATSGPDQGQAFLGVVGKANASGLLVPDGWYGAYANALNNEMVEEYIARYGGTATDINADVAEAFSVGEVGADAIIATGGTDQAKIIRYLHSGVTLQTVQGAVRFESDGENPQAVAFISQWTQAGSFVQVLPTNVQGFTQIEFPKPNWTP
jgi:branched-chain amino acid transport system substrate-binding protein